MSIRTWHPAIGLYLALGIGALIFYLPNSANAEAGQLLLIAMVVITLPLGLLVVVVLGLSSWALEQVGVVVSFGGVLVWAILLSVGFVQWRYLAPWVIRKLQTHSQP